MHIPDKLSEIAKYHLLYSYVVDDLPTSVVADLVAAEYPLSEPALTRVRQGRNFDLAALCRMIEVGLPKFVIPDELRPIGYDFGSKYPMPTPGPLLPKLPLQKAPR